MTFIPHIHLKLYTFLIQVFLFLQSLTSAQSLSFIPCIFTQISHLISSVIFFVPLASHHSLRRPGVLFICLLSCISMSSCFIISLIRFDTLLQLTQIFVFAYQRASSSAIVILATCLQGRSDSSATRARREPKKMRNKTCVATKMLELRLGRGNNFKLSAGH